ncbi:MAG: hypothetical protein ABJA78_11170 [Ferruginibacter sp.]
MKQITPLIILLLFTFSLTAQRLSKADQLFFTKKEDSMKDLALNIIQGRTKEDRVKADSAFTRIFVRALNSPHSFQYPFDSLVTISMLCPADSSFRIYTWQLVVDDNRIRQHGAIQLHTDDGSLKLLPLSDRSDNTIGFADTTGNNKAWMGAVYYKIIQKKKGAENIYTLLGYDENNIRSSRKIIEILTFNNGEPLFGGRYFSFEEDSIFRSSVSRYVMEYKKEAGPRLTYDDELDMIVMEHLISETGEINKKYTLVGDGDYEGFKWRNGKWVHVEKVFHYVTPEGKEPVPSPLRSDDGTIDKTKLKNNGEVEDETPENKTPVTKPAVVKPKTPVKKKPKG